MRKAVNKPEQIDKNEKEAFLATHPHKVLGFISFRDEIELI